MASQRPTSAFSWAGWFGRTGRRVGFGTVNSPLPGEEREGERSRIRLSPRRNRIAAARPPRAARSDPDNPFPESVLLVHGWNIRVSGPWGRSLAPPAGEEWGARF